ncbi:hypothetical protein Neosp_013849 [[Neocosmospora] mangrovei]
MPGGSPSNHALGDTAMRNMMKTLVKLASPGRRLRTLPCCNRFWTREQKKGFRQTVKDLKKFKLNQLSGHVSNNVNRRLAKLEIMQIRVMAGHENSWLFHSLSEEKPRIQKTRHAREEEERVKRDQIRKETVESLIHCGAMTARDLRALDSV